MMENAQSSIKNFMAGMGIKFFLWMVFTFVYLYNIEVNSRIFLLDFFYIYFFHTGFEISSLLHNLRNQNLR
jgi:acetyltransferase-like isoleucine patch superfamily enzyme